MGTANQALGAVVDLACGHLISRREANSVVQSQKRTSREKREMAALTPFRITVCGFEELPGQCKAGVTHILSILDPGAPAPVTLESFGEHRRLELRFHDIIEEAHGMKPPRLEHIEQLLGLGRDLATRDAGNLHLLVHCHAGFSRSPAALAVILAQARPTLSAEAIAAEVLRVRPNSWPNLRIIELGDHKLDRRGDLVEVASTIYRCRLQQQPELAELIIANNRAREVEAGRR